MSGDGLRTTFADERLAMLAALVNGDTALAFRVAQDCLSDGVSFDRIIDDVLQPVQETLGHRWADGELGIADEHAATAAIEELLVKLGATAEAPSGPTVVIVSAPGDTHSLGVRAVSGALALEGFRSFYLGTSVPATELGDFLEFHQPFALALGCSIPAALAGAAAATRAAHGVNVPVLGGGRALRNASRATRLGIDAFAATPREAVQQLRVWETARPERLVPAVEPIVEHERLAERGLGLISAALDGFPAAASRAALGEDLGRVLAIVEAAIMLDEPEIIDEHLSWLRDTSTAHGVDRALLDATLRSLAAAMDGELQRVGEFLRCAIG